jgi:two-component sensor histidine kinase
MVLLITKDGSPHRTTRAYQLIGRDTMPMADASPYVNEAYDPRTSIWFSKALESARREPVWSLRDIDQADRTGLFVSHLIRGRTEHSPFRILVFHVDIGLSPWVDVRSSPLHQFGAMLLDDAGRMLNIPDERKPPHVIGAEQAAVEAWKARQTSSPFPIDHADRQFRAMITAYFLNGLTLYAGTLMDVDMIAKWTDTERRGIMVAATLLMLIIFLLAWMWIRRKRQVESIRRQEKYSRSQERKLAKALGEREVLNREVHHRVKNNLQVVSSLLNLQANRQEDAAVRTEFMRGKQRIDIIALVHHKLYGMQDLRRVDLKLFFSALIEQLGTMYAPMSRTISYELDTGKLRADQDTAIELGIILCELVSNCYQHAFPYATGGHIDISVQAVEGDLYRLLVKDNGKGLAESYADGPGKLGLEIVDALAGQLDGSFHTRTNGGTTFEILFRMKPASVLPDPGGTQPHGIDETAAGL